MKCAAVKAAEEDTIVENKIGKPCESFHFHSLFLLHVTNVHLLHKAKNKAQVVDVGRSTLESSARLHSDVPISLH